MPLQEVIPAGELYVEIYTNALTDTALILVTPDKPVPVGKEVIGEAEFRIILEEIQNQDITVDWLIVDIQEASDQ